MSEPLTCPTCGGIAFTQPPGVWTPAQRTFRLRCDGCATVIVTDVATGRIVGHEPPEPARSEPA